MNHISEDQLVLFYYGESTEAAAIENHLSGCESCRSELRSLQLVLNTLDSAPVPERPADYGQTIWKKMLPHLAAPRRRTIRQWWIWAPVMAALLLGAFVAGSLWQRVSSRSVAKNQNNQQIRERILLVAVGDHLERSQMVLAELDHAPDGKGKLDISGERQMAEDLLDDNRLYRQTARSTGDNSMASVLDDLERVLLEIAHSPSDVSNEQLDDLRQQIESRGLLFKIRVLGSAARGSETHSLETNPVSGKVTNSKKL
jgi:polyhydroxyalkanoate synthesis regulator phasin